MWLVERQSGQGHRPSLQSGGRPEAWNNGRNGAGRGRYVRYDCGSSCSDGSIRGGGSHKHLVGRLGPDGLH